MSTYDHTYLSKIVPAVDLIDGKIVRLTQGDYESSKTYHSDPLEQAQYFESIGIERLHVVDLDGARSGSPKHFRVLEKIATKTHLVVDFSGGLRDEHTVKAAFGAGASIICVGSMAVRDPAFVGSLIIKYPKKVIVGADIINGSIATDGWLKKTTICLEELLKTFNPSSVRGFLVTDISRDGMMEGANIDLYKKLVAQFPKYQFIASGGVQSNEEIISLLDTSLSEVIVGKALYEGRVQLEKFQHGS